MTAFVFTAVWHRLSLTFIIWGFAMGTLMCVEKLARDRLLRHDWARTATAGRVIQVLGPLYVLAVNTTGFYFVIGEMID